jgi:hypothetical protein
MRRLQMIISSQVRILTLLLVKLINNNIIKDEIISNKYKVYHIYSFINFYFLCLKFNFYKCLNIVYSIN